MAHQRDLTHCVEGHEFTPENTYITPSTGHRKCRACQKARRQMERIRAGHPDLRKPGPKPARVDLSWFTTAELEAAYRNRDDMSWRDLAACLTDKPHSEWTDQWFVTRGVTSDVADRAQAICEGCPVRLECLAFGLWEKYGTWGGMSERARRRLRVGIEPQSPRRVA